MAMQVTLFLCLLRHSQCQVFFHQTYYSAWLSLMQFELQILSRLVHSNIVRVYGGCMTPPNLFVVAELMNGDLNSFIHKRGPSSPPLTLRSVLGIALDVVKGLVS